MQSKSDLGGFSLSSASRACRRGTQLQVQGCGECHVAAVCHWSHHQTPLCAKVLISVNEPAHNTGSVRQLSGYARYCMHCKAAFGPGAESILRPIHVV